MISFIVNFTKSNGQTVKTSLLELKQWQHHCAMLSFLTLFSEKPAPIRILILQDYIHTYIIKVSFPGHGLNNFHAAFIMTANVLISKQCVLMI